MWKRLKEQKESKQLGEAQLFRLQAAAIEKLRAMRWKMDQYLEKGGIDPVFHDHYLTYTREEFLRDAEVNFNKIKTMMQHTPKQIKEDTEIAPYFDDVYRLIKKAEVIEKTTSGYYDTDSAYNWTIDEKKKEQVYELIDDGEDLVVDAEDLATQEEAGIVLTGERKTPEQVKGEKKIQLIEELKNIAKTEDLKVQEEKEKARVLKAGKAGKKGPKLTPKKIATPTKTKKTK